MGAIVGHLSPYKSIINTGSDTKLEQQWRPNFFLVGFIMLLQKSAAGSLEFAGYGEEKLSNVVVIGNVFCEACSGRTSYFIPGAMVGLECRVDSNRKTRSPPSLVVEVAESDEYGDFLLEVPSAFHVEERIKDCRLILVSSPEGSCNVPSTRKPCDLNLLSVHPNGLRVYTCADPLYYRPPLCSNRLLKKVTPKPK